VALMTDEPEVQGPPFRGHFSIYKAETGRIMGGGYGQPQEEPGYGIYQGEELDGALWDIDLESRLPVPRAAATATEVSIELGRAKREAADLLIRWLNQVGQSQTGDVPDDEKLTYDAKETAARAVAAELQGGPTADPAHHSIIAIESALVGETFEVTMGKILYNATVFRIFGPVMSGLRRKGQTLIAIATTAAEVGQVLDIVRDLYLEILADPFSFAADPFGWMTSH
jgi:hypothetical protein